MPQLHRHTGLLKRVRDAGECSGFCGFLDICVFCLLLLEVTEKTLHDLQRSAKAAEMPCLDCGHARMPGGTAPIIEETTVLYAR